MQEAHDTDRTLGDIARLGTVATVDLATGRCTVTVGDLVTGPLRWLAISAGTRLTSWSPPGVGEQVLLICPEGEIAAGVVLRGIYSDAHPAPASDDAHSLHFPDGTILRYDAIGHHLTAVVAAGGTAAITAPGGLTVTADVTITGKVTISGDVDVTGKIDASADVTGQGTSLHGHKHGQVKAGTDQSGVPA